MGRLRDRDQGQPLGPLFENCEIDEVVIVVQPLKGPVVEIAISKRSRGLAKPVWHQRLQAVEELVSKLDNILRNFIEAANILRAHLREDLFQTRNKPHLLLFR